MVREANGALAKLSGHMQRPPKADEWVAVNRGKPKNYLQERSFF